MRLDPSKFDRFLGRQGDVAQAFGWRRATACPCVNPASGSAKSSCPVCFGKGRFWSEEATRDCFAGMSTPTQGKAIAAFGSWESGDAVLTVPASSALYALRQYDRVRCLNASVPFSEVIVRGQNDRLFGTVLRIDNVFWYAEDGETQVPGGMPTIADNGSLTWSDNAPPVGTPYTIEGAKSLEFYLYNALPSVRNVGGAPLPKRVPVRRFDLFGR